MVILLTAFSSSHPITIPPISQNSQTVALPIYRGAIDRSTAYVCSIVMVALHLGFIDFERVLVVNEGVLRDEGSEDLRGIRG
jgi:hypothetical protein